MQIFSTSDKGRVRENNQDYCLSGTFGDGAVYLVVCDGMGGVSGGQVASKICAETAAALINKGYRSGAKLSSLKNLLDSAVTAANSAVYETAKDDPELSGMGTTVVAAIITSAIAVIAHAGDSRAYLLRNNIKQITKDHSVVQYMVDMGRISEEEAKTHPDKNIITRAVGVDKTIRVDIDVEDVFADDIFLFCTDGLNGMVTDETIESVIKENPNCDFTRKLVEQANGNGGRDNITVAAVIC